MIDFHYISPSLLPSRSANSVHVALQCEGLARAGAKVSLYAKRTLPDPIDLPRAMRESYGIDTRGIEVLSCYSRGTRGDTLRIAAFAAKTLPRNAGAILSRNLYASYFLGVLQRRPILFETHQLELGVRKVLQQAIMTRPWVKTVVISEKLLGYLGQHHGILPAQALVQHDAARDGIEIVPAERRRRELGADENWEAVCGYFGHLYVGRGVEIIDAMAAARPRCLFLVYGGNESDIEHRRKNNTLPNLSFMGHVPHPEAQRVMARVDVLLMPYQDRVSIGVAGHDTAGWMSPMKMFEYMAAGVPIISSDLPVLREVLKDGRNCRLVPPANATAWIAALDDFVENPAAALELGKQAHAEYRSHYSWTRRAEALIAAAQN